ncbi:MAG: hypothetical protein KAG53_05015 [Endozoicomonadaceae bacterium]|nr:hypothetical protein [Endozoicomonadaceae bacterium]
METKQIGINNRSNGAASNITPSTSNISASGTALNIYSQNQQNITPQTDTSEDHSSSTTIIQRVIERTVKTRPTKTDSFLLNIHQEIQYSCQLIYDMINRNKVFKDVLEKSTLTTEYDKKNQLVKTLRIICSNLIFNAEYLEKVMTYYETSPEIYIGNLIQTAIYGNTIMSIATKIDAANQDGRQEFFSMEAGTPSIVPTHLRALIPTVIVCMWADLSPENLSFIWNSLLNTEIEKIWGERQLGQKEGELPQPNKNELVLIKKLVLLFKPFNKVFSISTTPSSNRRTEGGYSLASSSSGLVDTSALQTTNRSLALEGISEATQSQLADCCQAFKCAYDIISTIARVDLVALPEITDCLYNFKLHSKNLNLTLDDHNNLESTCDNMEKILCFFVHRILDDKREYLVWKTSQSENSIQVQTFKDPAEDIPIHFYFDKIDDKDGKTFLSDLAKCDSLNDKEKCMTFFNRQLRLLELPRSSLTYSDLETNIKITQMIFCKTNLYHKLIKDLISTNCQIAFNYTAACFMQNESIALRQHSLSGGAYLSLATRNLGFSNTLYFSPSDQPAARLHKLCVDEILKFAGTAGWKMESNQLPNNDFPFLWMYDSPITINPYVTFLHRINNTMWEAYNNNNSKINFKEITIKLIQLTHEVNKKDLLKEENPILNIKYYLEKIINMSLENQPPSITYSQQRTHTILTA